MNKQQQQPQSFHNFWGAVGPLKPDDQSPPPYTYERVIQPQKVRTVAEHTMGSTRRKKPQPLSWGLTLVALLGVWIVLVATVVLSLLFGVATYYDRYELQIHDDFSIPLDVIDSKISQAMNRETKVSFSEPDPRMVTREDYLLSSVTSFKNQVLRDIGPALSEPTKDAVRNVTTLEQLEAVAPNIAAQAPDYKPIKDVVNGEYRAVMQEFANLIAQTNTLTDLPEPYYGELSSIKHARIGGTYFVTLHEQNYHSFVFKVTKGQSFTITAKEILSLDRHVDPYLLLYNNGRKKVAENDDMTYFDTDAKITYTATYTGTMSVVVSNFGQDGKVRIALELQEH